MKRSVPKMDWKFSQVFGDKGQPETVCKEDIISAIAFDKSGRYVSVGDRAGRLIIFEQPPT